AAVEDSARALRREAIRSLRNSFQRGYRRGDNCAGCFDRDHLCANCEDGLDKIVKKPGTRLPASRKRKINVEDEEPRARHRQPSESAISTFDLHARIKVKMLDLMELLKDKCASCWMVGEQHEHGYQSCLQLKIDNSTGGTRRAFATTWTGRRERRATGADFRERSARRILTEDLSAGQGTAPSSTQPSSIASGGIRIRANPQPSAPC
ncbi:hypothetical protein A4X13_0g8416, partial [Tilletia indica]